VLWLENAKATWQSQTTDPRTSCRKISIALKIRANRRRKLALRPGYINLLWNSAKIGGITGAIYLLSAVALPFGSELSREPQHPGHQYTRQYYSTRHL
jgi:hypothetical protein